jgi:hypothetical protein
MTCPPRSEGDGAGVKTTDGFPPAVGVEAFPPASTMTTTITIANATPMPAMIHGRRGLVVVNCWSLTRPAF